MTDKITCSFYWRERNGCKFGVSNIVADNFKEARETAKKHGYPGHEGGWWNYFVDDSHALLKRFGLVR